MFHYKEDGAWQFSGDDIYEDFEEVVRVISLGEILKLDESILELADLPLGFMPKDNQKARNGILKKSRTESRRDSM